MQQVQKELLKPDRLHHLSYYQKHSIKGEKKVYTDLPEKKKKKKISVCLAWASFQGEL